ncbi:MAG: GNAT family N-acetyltransferase [Gordonia paraffinivorans]
MARRGRRRGDHRDGRWTGDGVPRRTREALSTDGSRRAGATAPALRRLHSTELDDSLRRDLRSLLDAAFEDDFSDDDWYHALGGVHVLAELDDVLVGHAAVVPRRVWTDGVEMACGYVEAVAVSASARRRGVGVALMREIDELLAPYDLGALAATDAGAPLYSATGWTTWSGELSVRGGDGSDRPTPGDRGAVMVTGDPRTVARASDETAVLTVEDRPGDPW